MNVTTKPCIPLLLCLLLTVSLLAACGTDTPEASSQETTTSTGIRADASWIAGKDYTPTGAFDGSPYLSFLDDGSFHYTQFIYTSYGAFGSWSVEGDRLTLTVDTGKNNPTVTHRFRIESAEELIFLAEESDAFRIGEVPDGTRFYVYDRWGSADSEPSD